MKSLNQALTKIDVMLPPKKYIENILQVTCDNLDYLFGTVIEIDDKGEAYMIASYNLPENYPEMVNKADASILSGPAGEAFETGKIVVVHDPFSDPRLEPWKNLEIFTGPIETIIWVPLFKNGKVFGICAYQSENKKEISQDGASMLEQIGVMISIAIISNQYLDKLTKRTNELEKEIAERKKIENELRNLHNELELKVEERTTELLEVNKKLQLFRDQIDQSNDAIFVTDPETAIILDANEKACNSLGYARDELINMRMMDIEVTFPDLDSWKNYITAIKNKKYIAPCEGINIRKDGTTFPIEASDKIVTYNGKMYLVAVVRDITDRKQNEIDRILNEARLEVLFKISQMKDATINETADFMLEEAIKLTGSTIGYINTISEDESVQNVISYSKSVMKQCNLDKQIDFITKDLGLGGETIRQRKPVIINDYSAPNPYKKGYPDGHVQIVRYMNVPLLYKGKIVATAALANKEDEYNDSDIRQLTLLMSGMWEHIKRIEYEKELMETKNYLEMIVTMSYDGILVVDEEGKFEFGNDACLEILGYANDEFIGKPFMEVIPEEYTDFMLDRWHEVQAGEGRPYETTIIRKDGTKRNLLVSHTDFMLNDKRKYCVIIKDVTADITEYINTVIKTMDQNGN